MIAALLLAFAGAGAGGAEYRSAHFVVHADDAPLARVVAGEAEAARRDVALRWGGRELEPTAAPWLIHVTVDPEVTLANGSTWAPFGGSFVVIGLVGPTPAEATRYVSHEVGHAVSHALAGGLAPLWLSEGVAVDAEPGYPYRLGEGVEVMDLGDLLACGDYPVFFWERFYGQSYSVSRYLLSRFGREALWKFADHGRRGGYEDASWVYLGISLEQLDQEWRESLASWDSPYPKTLRGR